MDVSNREQVFEDAFEADVFPFGGGGIRLQQRLEGARLDVEEMGHFHPLVELNKGDLLHRGFRHRSPGHR